MSITQSEQAYYRGYAALEKQLLALVAQYFPFRTNPQIDNLDNYFQELRLQAGSLRRRVRRLISRVSPQLNQLAGKALRQYAEQVVAESDSRYREAQKAGLIEPPLGYDPLSFDDSPELGAITDHEYSLLLQRLERISGNVENTIITQFQQIISTIFLLLAVGALSYQDAERKAIKDFATQGIIANVVSSIGRTVHEDLDSYVHTTYNTARSQLQGKLVWQRAEDWGSDIVEVSSHLGARPSHADWQGGLYSRTGKADGYPDLVTVTGYGTDYGLKGVNCNHEFWEFIVGHSKRTQFPYDTEENSRVYKETQTLRRYERRLQELNQNQEVAKARGDTEEAQKYQSLFNRKLEEAREYARQTDQVVREDRL